MVESTSAAPERRPKVTLDPKKPLIVTIGTLGVGKSTLMNRIIADDREEFQTSGDVDGCTSFFDPYILGDFTIVDTPGLGDVDLPFALWVQRFNESGLA